MAIVLPCPMPAQKKIAIVGKAQSSLGLAPYHDDSWQIWTLSDSVLAKQATRYEVQFELHDPALVQQRPIYWDWLARCEPTKPIFMRETHPDIKASVAFPINEIVSEFGGYFTNTVSYMIALAIAMQPDTIGVWGVDMACTAEYRAQRPSCEYFLGIAVGRGINVAIPPQADLLKTCGLYAFDDKVSDLAAKSQARAQELQGRISSAEQRRDQAAAEAAYLQGALEDTRDYWSQWFHQS
jgi:hypothetical protein